MKKIREILFTIVMIASCGCLLNIGTYASLTQNDNLIETESVSTKEEFEKRQQRIHEKVQAEEKEGRAKQYKKFYDKFTNEILSNPSADPGAILDSFYFNSPFPDEVKETFQDCQVALFKKQLQDLYAFINEKDGTTRFLNDAYYGSFCPESQGMHRRPKSYEEWLAEYKKNEREGNFELPSIFDDEEDVRSSSLFYSLPEDADNSSAQTENDESDIYDADNSF